MPTEKNTISKGVPLAYTRKTFTCSKLRIGTLQRGEKYHKDVVLVFLLLTLSILFTFF